MNRSIIPAVLAALLLAGLAGCSKGKGPLADRYLSEPVKIGDVEKTVLATGALQPQEVVNVGAQATGQIQSLKVEVGDVVKKGQQLAVIDPAIQQNTLLDAQAAQASVQGQKAVQEATLTKTRLDLDRQKTLFTQGFASKAAVDQAQAQYDISLASLSSINAQLSQAGTRVEKARVDLGRTNVIAPIDGVVASVLVREGQTVNAVQMSPTLLRLAKMDTMTIKAQISEADVINVHPGQQVYFTILGDAARRYYGAVRTVEPAPENAGDSLTAPANTAVYYNAVFDVPNSDGRLRSSMTAQVNVVLGQAKGVLTGPSGALGKPAADGTYLVKVLDDKGIAHDRKIKVGVIDTARFEVLDGLKAGEKVMVGDAWNAAISGNPKQPAKK